jgi:hypothetical protein
MVSSVVSSTEVTVTVNQTTTLLADHDGTIDAAAAWRMPNSLLTEIALRPSARIA